MKNFKFMFQSGVSLIEVMVAGSMLAGLSVAVMKLGENSQKVMTRVEKGSEIAEIHQEINALFADKQNCTMAVRRSDGLTPSGYTTQPTLLQITSGPPLAIPVFYDILPVTGYAQPMISVGTKRNNVEIFSAEISSYSDVSVNNRPNNSAVVAISYRYYLSSTQLTTKTRHIIVNVTPDQTNPTLFGSCVSYGGISDSLWAQGTNGIYKEPGVVAVGKTANTATSAMFEVAGGVILGPLAGSTYGVNTLTNTTTNLNNNILGGHSNTINSQLATNGIIVGGHGSDINTANFHAGIFGGGDHTINGTGNYSAIVGGHQSTVSSTESAIVAGYFNNVTSNNAGIFTGHNNTVSAESAVIVGGVDNVASGVRSAVTGGDRNRATHDNTAVFGGYTNTASSANAAVIGGFNNRAASPTSAVFGGYNNLSDDNNSVVVGGYNNNASKNDSVILGGHDNFANGFSSAVVGGEVNDATGTRSVVIGGSRNQATETWTGVLGGSVNYAESEYATIVGGMWNRANTGARAAIMGGQYNTTTAMDGIALGGRNNTVKGEQSAIMASIDSDTDGARSVIIGSFNSHSGGNAHNSVVIGGNANTVDRTSGIPPAGVNAVVAGGQNNLANGEGNFVAGGYSQTVNGTRNVSIGAYNSRVGGVGNENAILGGIDGYANGSQQLVLGGQGNSVRSGEANVILAGANSYIQNSMRSAIIAGDMNAITRGNNNAIVGGYSNSIGYLGGNEPDSSVILGGHNHFIRSSLRSVILGGRQNSIIDANDSIVIGGSRLQVTGEGSIFLRSGDMDSGMWIDNRQNSFSAQFTNRIEFCSGGNCTTMVPGGAGWNPPSDRKLKKHFKVFDYEELLLKLEALPITTWQYKVRKDNRRNMGPMSQDFYNIVLKDYGMGDDDVTINDVDMHGVTLAGVKALANRTNELKKENKDLKEKILRMQEQLDAINAKLDHRK